ncbi:glycosyl hydrolase family 71-domain-containing protein [Mucidula mucida]|nr:glycosyl hydrolase family 71-domain-containing protein [Mucidula mucida]
MRVAHFSLLFPILALSISSAIARLEQRSSHNVFHHKGAKAAVSSTNDSLAEVDVGKRDNTKYVFMHHFCLRDATYVRNRYPYTKDTWRADIAQIGAKGVDAIALNIGSDWWQPNQIQMAYEAASETNMKIFISFDYTAFDCSSASASIALFNRFKGYSSQFYYNGRPMLSSYAGSCMSSGEWRRMKSETNAYLMPFMWGLEGRFTSEYSFLDSWLCWGCAWPQGNKLKDTADDQYYINQLGNRFATTVSMWMYTHYSWTNKNFYQRGDDWLIFGPFGGGQPDGTYWAENFPHTAFFDLSQYYITAFKTGSYPAITQDVIYYWARPHAFWATASSDSLAKPDGWDWTTEYMWAVVYRQDFQVGSGITKLKIGLQPGQMMVQMVRSGQTVIYQSPSDFTYSYSTDKYNYNVYASAATGAPTSPSTTPTTTSTTSSSAPTASGWQAVGCMNEGTSGSRRALTGISYTSSDMTPDRYCGNSLKNNGATGQMIDSSVCNAPCDGDNSKMCGASWVLNVYTKTATTTTTTATSTPTSTWSNYGCVADTVTRRHDSTICQNLCKDFTYAATEYGTECYCSNSLTGGGAVQDASDCQTSCNGDSSQKCGGVWHLSVYSKAQPHSSVYLQWTSRGCYTDSNDRLLRSAYKDMPGMTTESCIQYTVYVWNVMYKTGGAGTAVDASQCNMSCEGLPFFPLCEDAVLINCV